VQLPFSIRVREPSALNKRSIRTLLVIALVMVGVPVLATTINKSIQPQRHAQARHCFSGDTNRCDHGIVAAYCQRSSASDRNDDPCQLQHLEPGEAFTNLAATSLNGARYTMACKAPFIPNWGPSMSNSALQVKRCRRPDPAPMQ
jgi:hypothetical protein